MSYLKKIPGMVFGFTSRDCEVAAYWFVNMLLESAWGFVGTCLIMPSLLAWAESGVMSRVGGCGIAAGSSVPDFEATPRFVKMVGTTERKYWYLWKFASVAAVVLSRGLRRFG
jgi:hypothetical protein